jgi:hypothetical protein
MGLGDNRMTARTRPSTTPPVMAITVSSTVVTKPWTISEEKKKWSIIDHSKRSLFIPFI